MTTTLPVEYTPEQQGFALERLGKPITQCTRREQRLIQSFIAAETDELEKRVKVIMDDLVLDAAVQKVKGMDCCDQLADIMSKLATDIRALQGVKKEANFHPSRASEGNPDGSDMDVESVTETTTPDGFTQQKFKTPNGKLKREVLFTKELARIQQAHADLTEKLSTAPGGATKTVIVGKVENTQNNYGENAVADKLGKFMDAEPVDAG